MSEKLQYFEDGQMVLLPSSEMEDELFSEDEREGKYTALRLKSSRPEIYNLVVSMLAEGLSIRAIRRATRCHAYTIQAVCLAEPKLIETLKERNASKLKLLASMTIDKARESIEELEVKNVRDLQSLGVFAGIITEKAELLSGNPTHRIVREEERMEDVKKHFDSLPSGPSAAIEAEFTDSTSFSVETPELKSGLIGSSPKDQWVDSNSGQTDTESGGSRTSSPKE